MLSSAGVERVFACLDGRRCSENARQFVSFQTGTVDAAAEMYKEGRSSCKKVRNPSCIGLMRAHGTRHGWPMSARGVGVVAWIQRPPAGFRVFLDVSRRASRKEIIVLDVAR